jgi:hypothetical protein
VERLVLINAHRDADSLDSAAATLSFVPGARTCSCHQHWLMGYYSEHYEDLSLGLASVELVDYMKEL